MATKHASSEPRKSSFGVLQGNFFGPVLFENYIIDKNSHQETKSILYAHETVTGLSNKKTVHSERFEWTFRSYGAVLYSKNCGWFVNVSPNRNGIVHKHLIYFNLNR